jgi:hypothetical protein
MIEEKKDRWLGKKYRGEMNFLVLVELLLGIYFSFNIYFAYINKIYVSIPFLMIFQMGFFYVAFLSIYQVILRGIFSCRFARHLFSKRNADEVIAAQ